MSEITFKAFQYKCDKCGHEWIPQREKYLRGEAKPATCPNCRSPYWDRSDDSGGSTDRE